MRKKALLIITSVTIFFMISCEKEATNNNSTTKDRIVLNDSQILYHYYSYSSIDDVGNEMLWEECNFEYDNQNRISKMTQYYYDPTGKLDDKNIYVYTYSGNRVIMNAYTPENVNYSRKVYLLNSDNLAIIDSSFAKGLYQSPQFFNESNTDYSNKKMSRTYSKDSPRQTKYYWQNGNIKKVEEYVNGVLDKADSIGTYSTLINKNYRGDFFLNGRKNRNWYSIMYEQYPKAEYHTYKTDANGFVMEDLTIFEDVNGKILRKHKEVYK